MFTSEQEALLDYMTAGLADTETVRLVTAGDLRVRIQHLGAELYCFAPEADGLPAALFAIGRRDGAWHAAAMSEGRIDDADAVEWTEWQTPVEADGRIVGVSCDLGLRAAIYDSARIWLDAVWHRLLAPRSGGLAN
jgi:hypothetical protein